MHGLQACSCFLYSTFAQRGGDAAKGEVGGCVLNSHGKYFGNHGKSWKNHGIVFLNLCENPDFGGER